MNDWLLPRFPQPFLQLLLAYCAWRDILNMLSVDKREAVMRKFWISTTAKLPVWPDDASVRKATTFAKNYPRCHIEQQLTNGATGKIVKGVTHLIYFSSVMSKALAQCDSLVDIYFDEDQKFDVSKLVLPPHLKSLRFSCQSFDMIPALGQSLTTLIIGNDAYDIVEQFEAVKLPQSLVDLHVEFFLPTTHGFLPQFLKRLIFGGFESGESVAQDYWPMTLTHLAFIYYMPENNVILPKNLEFLQLDRSNAFDQSNVCEIEWPINLHTLSFGGSAPYIAEELEDHFPPSVTLFRVSTPIPPWNEDPFSIFQPYPSAAEVPEIYQYLVEANIERIKSAGKSDQAGKRRRITEPGDNDASV